MKGGGGGGGGGGAPPGTKFPGRGGGGGGGGGAGPGPAPGVGTGIKTDVDKVAISFFVSSSSFETFNLFRKLCKFSFELLLFSEDFLFFRIYGLLLPLKFC